MNQQWINSESTVNQRWINSESTVNQQWIYSESTVNQQWINSESTVNQQWINGESTVNQQWINSESTVNRRWINGESTVNQRRITGESTVNQRWINSESFYCVSWKLTDWGSSVTTVTWLMAGQLNNCVSFQGKDKRIFSSPQCPYWFWAYRASCPTDLNDALLWGKAARHDCHHSCTSKAKVKHEWRLSLPPPDGFLRAQWLYSYRVISWFWSWRFILIYIYI